MNFNELNSQQKNGQANEQADVQELNQEEITIELNFDIQVWLQKCNTISCCTIRCIHHIPPEELTAFKTNFNQWENMNKNFY